MADVAKGYGIGDTVFVTYPFPSSNYFTPQERIVKSVDVISGTNEATVSFEAGAKVLDGAVQTVYTTQALAATAIVDDVITNVSASVTLDATTSAASSSGQASGDLVRGS